MKKLKQNTLTIRPQLLKEFGIYTPLCSLDGKDMAWELLL